ncbi:hypothetical protein EXN66_Car007792 [Channa argus]|uniref:Uncharacterized protein n=1 Tax=Channa argus TaxID=215402 RepID=A0A6G1PQ40_CHAAH|nr:hypothetical protein EXN66_Car007792 [Channa argus]
MHVCLCMFVCDIHECDSVRGAWWFPKQAVSLTEGLFVKDYTGKNLSMSDEWKEKERGRMREGEEGECNRESALTKLKRPVRAEIGRERREVSEETVV